MQLAEEPLKVPRLPRIESLAPRIPAFQAIEFMVTDLAKVLELARYDPR